MEARNEKEKNRLTRSFNGQIRAKEGEDRIVELSFSSEEPYMRWFGLEILDHSEGAVDLTRLNDIGCMLFNHNSNKVVGKVMKAWVEGNRCKAEVRFDKDEDSDIIYQKVLTKTLQGVSVGYDVLSWEDVSANATSSDGKYKGPCSIARVWEPYEISIVSIPADATVGVGRSREENKTKTAIIDDKDIYERQFQINLNS
ncbi:MAG: HK97 family phage prohead protease [Ruminococcus sp.]